MPSSGKFREGDRCLSGGLGTARPRDELDFETPELQSGFREGNCAVFGSSEVDKIASPWMDEDFSVGGLNTEVFREAVLDVADGGGAAVADHHNEGSVALQPVLNMVQSEEGLQQPLGSNRAPTVLHHRVHWGRARKLWEGEGAVDVWWLRYVG
ncbi:hypothetical protein ABZP36_003849 [Zizania latifolia]